MSDINPFRRIGFVAYDTFKSLLQDENGKISGPRTVMAGFAAGCTESLLAVTPFESIKTQLYVIFGIFVSNGDPLLYYTLTEISKESMTGNLPIRVCAVSSMEAKSYFKNEGSVGFFKASSLLPHARQPTPQQDLGAIQL